MIDSIYRHKCVMWILELMVSVWKVTSCAKTRREKNITIDKRISCTISCVRNCQEKCGVFVEIDNSFTLYFEQGQ